MAAEQPQQKKQSIVSQLLAMLDMAGGGCELSPQSSAYIRITTCYPSGLMSKHYTRELDPFHQYE